jgi:hypothetical protein
MAEIQPTVYDYTSDQHEMLRIYEFRTAALVGRDFHAGRLHWLRLGLHALDAVTTVCASGAFVSLAVWKTPAGSVLLEGLVFLVAAASIARSSFRLSDLADSHARLAYSWKEIFMDLDQVAHAAKCEGVITDRLRAEMDFLILRFQRVEAMDDMRADSKTQEKLQAKAEQQLAIERQWLPSA